MKNKEFEQNRIFSCIPLFLFQAGFSLIQYILTTFLPTFTYSNTTLPFLSLKSNPFLFHFSREVASKRQPIRIKQFLLCLLPLLVKPNSWNRSVYGEIPRVVVPTFIVTSPSLNPQRVAPWETVRTRQGVSLAWGVLLPLGGLPSPALLP